MKAIVVGSGAGGAVAARELARNGFEVTILEAGKPFSPLTHKVSWLSSLQGLMASQRRKLNQTCFSTLRCHSCKPRIGNFQGRNGRRLHLNFMR